MLLVLSPVLCAGKRQRVSPQDNAFHFFHRDDAEKEAPRKPHLEEAAMALLLLDVHPAPGKVTCLCSSFMQVACSYGKPGTGPSSQQHHNITACTVTESLSAGHQRSNRKAGPYALC